MFIMKLLIKDAEPEWDGTSYVAVEYNPSDIDGELLNSPPSYITFQGKIECGARLRYIKPGNGVLIMDRYLRRDLRFTENQKVEFEPLNMVEAQEVTVGISDETLKGDEYRKLIQTFLDQQPLSKGQVKPIYLYNGKEVAVSIKNVIPQGILTFNTEINFVNSQAQRGIFFKDIGGLDNEIQLIRERVELPLLHYDKLIKLGIAPPRGVLLLGPPGCGKTMIARALSNELGANFYEISGPEIFNPYYGESEKQLRDIFAKAKNNAPSVILIDEIDAIATSRQDMGLNNEMERRIVTTLLTEMDGIHDIKNVIVLATTNHANSMDPALRRPGRFDYEINIGIPDKNGREVILDIHTRRMELENREQILRKVARMSHGYTGADIMLLTREAAYCSLQRNFPQGFSGELTELSKIKITLGDFERALNRIKPTGMREFSVRVSSEIDWNDLGGLKNVKDSVREEIIKSIKSPEIFEKVGLRPVKGILLYGPPGTGKTLLAKIIANEAGANFISVKGPEIFSRWLGESENRVRQIFLKAREVSPCIIFFDEIDAITASRGDNENSARVVNQLLAEMDGIESSKGVYIMAATNRKELIDQAFLRPGRFDYHIQIPLPEDKERVEIFKIHLKGKPHSQDINLENLASKAVNFSGAHISEVCRRAGMQALREADFNTEKTEIRSKHLLKSIKEIKRTINELDRNSGLVEVA